MKTPHAGRERQPATVRVASDRDMPAAARLLDAFNREFDEPTPGANVLADRLRHLSVADGTTVLVAGSPPVGVAVLRFRAALWSAGVECYLAELYVTPERRGQGIGRALMDSAIAHARERGADTMDIGVDEPDVVARRLYESLGFTNRTGGPDGPAMFHYERDL